jgi:RNA polymerase sigma-70 factor (ECF subfamily)
MNESPSEYERIIAPIEGQMIRSIWRIVRHAQDAEDAMQNALLSVWKQWRRVAEHPNAQALVLKMCVDAAYDVTRRRYRRRDSGSDRSASEPVDQSPTPAQSAEDSEQHGKLLAAIHEMPRCQATATLMRAVQGQSYEAIASALGCAPVTARKHVARGRARLQTAFSRYLDGHPSLRIKS